MAHALVVPLPKQGHINPMMRLCRLLAKEGVRVTFVQIHPMGKLQDEHTINESGHEEQVSQIRRAHVPIEGLDNLSMETTLEALKRIGPHLQKLVLSLNTSGPRVTCLLSDMLMTGATQPVADAFSLPRVVLYTSSQSSLLFFHHLMAGSVSSTNAIDTVRSHPSPDLVFAEGLDGLPPLIHAADLPHFRFCSDETLYMYNFIERELLESCQTAHCLVVNSFDALERPAFNALSARVNAPVYGVGSLLDPPDEISTTSFWKEDEACMLWLDNQPPLSVLYVSFGSITRLSYPQFEEILHGLLASQHRFLLVIHPDLLETTPNGGKCHLDPPARGCIVDWAPQLRVLAHPSVGAFLTHCGWNSTIEAIHHGVPMLCWPYFGDQHFDAKFVVEEWRIGLRFNMKNGCEMIVSSEIERVIRAVMEGEEGKLLRKNARKFKEASNEAISPQGTSSKNIQTLLDSLHV